MKKMCKNFNKQFSLGLIMALSINSITLVGCAKGSGNNTAGEASGASTSQTGPGSSALVSSSQTSTQTSTQATTSSQTEPVAPPQRHSADERPGLVAGSAYSITEGLRRPPSRYQKITYSNLIRSLMMTINPETDQTVAGEIRNLLALESRGSMRAVALRLQELVGGYVNSETRKNAIATAKLRYHSVNDIDNATIKESIESNVTSLREIPIRTLGFSPMNIVVSSIDPQMLNRSYWPELLTKSQFVSLKVSSPLVRALPTLDVELESIDQFRSPLNRSHIPFAKELATGSKIVTRQHEVVQQNIYIRPDRKIEFRLRLKPRSNSPASASNSAINNQAQYFIIAVYEALYQ